MNLIIQKSIQYNIQDFFNKVVTLDYINGISLNVGVTKDEKIVVFNLSSGNEELLKAINHNTYNQLKNLEMVILEDILFYLNKNNYKMKVMLNLIPIEYKCVTEEETKVLYEKVDRYANNLIKIFQDKNNLNLYIHSTSRSLINILKEKNKNLHLGFAITTTDLNYIDVNYFVFSYEMINLTLIKQELDLGKEIFLFIGTAYEMSSVYDYLRGAKKTKLADLVYDKLFIMGDYPEILKKTFLD